MPQDIQLQRSLTNIPSTLLFGEPAWSESNNGFYIGNSSGTPILVNNLSNVNLQFAYNNSLASSDIITTSALGAFRLQRGSASDDDAVFTVRNGASLSTFNIQGNGLTRIQRDVLFPGLYIEPSTGITDPNINTRSARLYIEADRVNTADGIRVHFNDGGSPDFSGYIKFAYNGNSPDLNLLDMDDDPSYITFSIARLNLSNPGTFAAPAISSRFGGRGPFGGGLTGFSWQSNGGVSGGAFTEIMSCDNNFLSLPTRTTVNRPTSPVNNMIGYNSTLNKVEAFENGAWTQFVDTTTNQTIDGNKIFTGKIQSNNDVQQYFNATAVTTTSATFAVITGVSATTSTTLLSNYRVSSSLNIRHSTTNITTVEIQIFVNGVADPDTLISYSMSSNTHPIFIPINKIYNAAINTTFDVRWRRVSGTAVPTVTNKSLILQEIL